VLDLALEQVGDRLDAAVRVPRKPARYCSGSSPRKSSSIRNGSKSPTSEKPNARFRCTPALGSGLFDPFLMLDDFRGDDPEQYRAGLPVAPAPRHRDDHLPARGRGRARRQHGEQGRHRPRLRAVDDRRQRHHPPGDARGDERGRMGGFQLWANLPASDKMRDARATAASSRGRPGSSRTLTRPCGARRHRGRGLRSREDIGDRTRVPGCHPTAGRRLTHPNDAGSHRVRVRLRGSACFGETPTGAAADGACFGNGSVVLSAMANP